jgi:hypothetical protein
MTEITNDPVWGSNDTPHSASYRLFDLVLRVETNHDGVLAGMDHLYPRVTPQPAPPTDALVLRVLVERTKPLSEPAAMQPLAWRRHDAAHILALGEGFTCLLDMDAGRATIFAEAAWFDGAAEQTSSLLRGPTLMLINRRDRHPIHASGIRAGDRGLLLFGPSGAGKSTLAYSASRLGLTLLTDDSVRVQCGPTLRVWGMTGAVHLLDDARARFPELAAQSWPTVRARLGDKHVIPVVAPADDPWVSRVRVCLLGHERGPVELTRVSADEIVSTIVNAPEQRYDLAPEQRRRAAEAIAAGGGWRLRLSHDPAQAMPHLRDMLNEID